MPEPAVSQPIFLAIFSLFSASNQSAKPAEERPVLQISGEPTRNVMPAGFYAFTPTVFQNSTRPLQFSIQNKPSWASFGLRRGTLYGTPQIAHAGTYPNIIITVSDGEKTVQLPPFAIRVPMTGSPVVAHASR